MLATYTIRGVKAINRNYSGIAGIFSLYVFFGLLAYMPLHIFISTWLGSSFNVLEFFRIAKDILLVVGFIPISIVAFRRPELRKKFINSKLIWAIGAFTLLNIILLIIRPTQQDAEILGFVYHTRFFLFFIYGILLSLVFSKENIFNRALSLVFVSGAIVVFFGLFQYFVLPDDALKHVGYTRENGVLPAFFIDNKPDLERIMSTIRDPNSLGSYLIILTTLLATKIVYIKRNRAINYLFLGCSILGVILTFSRSAWVGLTIALVAMTYFLIYSNKTYKELIVRQGKKIIVAAAILFIITGGIFMVARDTYLLQNIVFHADEATVLEDPNQLRVRFFTESVVDIKNNPIGSGPGTAGLASIRNTTQGTVLNENYYLQVAQELGILGLVIFLLIIVLVANRLLYRFKISKNLYLVALLASFLGLLFTNLLVHIWSNEAVAYTWWGLAGIILFQPYSVTRNN